MTHVLIAGDRQSGKTTFLGLLYATKVRSGSDKGDDFRFHTLVESMDEISALFEQLMSGSFPDSATKEGIHGVSFHLGVRRPGLLSRLRARAWAHGDSATLRFTLLKAVDEEVSQLLRGSSIAHGPLDDILNGDAVAILVDSTRLGVKREVAGEDPEPSPMEEFDGAIESILSIIRRLRQPGGRTLVHPLFVFSKFDRVSPKVLQSAGVADQPPGVPEGRPRAAYAEALLEHNLPKTLARIRDRDRDRVRFAKPSYFFTWVRTEAASERSERIRLRRTGAGGWEPDYSMEEYLAFLECVRDIAVRAGD